MSHRFGDRRTDLGIGKRGDESRSRSVEVRVRMTGEDGYGFHNRVLPSLGHHIEPDPLVSLVPDGQKDAAFETGRLFLDLRISEPERALRDNAGTDSSGKYRLVMSRRCYVVHAKISVTEVDTTR